MSDNKNAGSENTGFTALLNLAAAREGAKEVGSEAANTQSTLSDAMAEYITGLLIESAKAEQNLAAAEKKHKNKKTRLGRSLRSQSEDRARSKVARVNARLSAVPGVSQVIAGEESSRAVKDDREYKKGLAEDTGANPQDRASLLLTGQLTPDTKTKAQGAAGLAYGKGVAQGQQEVQLAHYAEVYGSKELALDMMKRREEAEIAKNTAIAESRGIDPSPAVKQIQERYAKAVLYSTGADPNKAQPGGVAHRAFAWARQESKEGWRATFRTALQKVVLANGRTTSDFLSMDAMVDASDGDPMMMVGQKASVLGLTPVELERQLNKALFEQRGVTDVKQFYGQVASSLILGTMGADEINSALGEFTSAFGATKSRDEIDPTTLAMLQTEIRNEIARRQAELHDAGASGIAGTPMGVVPMFYEDTVGTGAFSRVRQYAISKLLEYGPQIVMQPAKQE